MSEPSFITDFIEKLQKLDRRALAILRRSASFAPGAYPAAYPYVEHHVGADWRPQDSRRQALYITAMLYALHPRQADVSLATALGRLMKARDSGSIELRFIALLAADGDELPYYLRQIVSLLAADEHGIDYAELLQDLIWWLKSHSPESRDRIRQKWARDFYRQLAQTPAAA